MYSKCRTGRSPSPVSGIKPTNPLGGGQMKSKKTRSILIGAITLLGTTSAQADTFSFLANPAYFGGVTNGDGFWGNVDFVTPGFNTAGAASSTNSGANGFYGYINSGGYTVNGNFATPGTKSITSLDGFVDMNLTPVGRPAILHLPYEFHLDSSAPATVTVNPDQTFTASRTVFDNFSNTYSLETTNGYYLKRGQSPDSMFADPKVVTHLNEVIPALPFNWNIVSFETLTGSINDTTESFTTFTLDESILGSFQHDMKPDQPSPGWDYLWNSGGPVNDLTSPDVFSALLPTGHPTYFYTATGDGNLPGPPPADYVYLGVDGSGHPGQGTLQNDIERFAIARFQVPVSGSIALINTELTLIGANPVPVIDEFTDGVSLYVFTSQHPETPFKAFLEPGFLNSLTFDQTLGHLNAGDFIFVAVGGRNYENSDTFALKFDVATVPLPPATWLLASALGGLAVVRRRWI